MPPLSNSDYVTDDPPNDDERQESPHEGRALRMTRKGQAIYEAHEHGGQHRIEAQCLRKATMQRGVECTCSAAARAFQSGQDKKRTSREKPRLKGISPKEQHNPGCQKEDHTRQHRKATDGRGILPVAHSASLFSSL